MTTFGGSGGQGSIEPVPDLPVSRTFLYELDELYTKRRIKEITEEEFITQRDALIAQEAKSQETMGPMLIAKQL
ncbi:hypothetical protein KSF_009710 [Reticulibacter mediterranei]|uniref:Uncharacterized protein n=1 Tax=Reticulibacter mediterranei TaxID=2778369 RepID=A0A8J3MZY1_9CHLR|nr:hypothetical protein [Reticulibacter mediterranei]GHO90923.1 hypothetical protein KSF_009710 [Reticulibacter mediterranei]